jgi:NADP-dependent 3-hydroxy acid dehydrogenase YdfG
MRTQEESMPVLAIVGAGPGMGLAIAKTFGANGYKVGLLSRNPVKLQPLVAELAEHGIEAAAFALDVLDRASMTAGLAAVQQRFGRIDVLEFSPAGATLPLALRDGLAADYEGACSAAAEAGR